MAAGISQANPFFTEDGKLGKDIQLPETRPSGGVQASNSPGLYGGAPGGDNGSSGEDGDGSTGGDNGSTGGGNGSPGADETGGPTGEFGGSTKPGTCVVPQLKEFLTDPKNSAKAREWARVLHIDVDDIPGYIDQLTPVVLRHDTLVTNHEFKSGKAVPFDALLQAGIAILVDKQGLPAVKCSCGNPLVPSKVNINKTSVRFEDGNKKWSGYQQNHIVMVEPPPGNPGIDRLQLVDVYDPDHGIARELGVGGDDQSFDTGTEHAVPTVTGMTFAEATRNLTEAGLAMAYDGDSLPPDDAPVTSSDPVEGTTLAWGAPVTLFVRSDDGSGGESSSPPDSGGVTTGPGESSKGTDGGTSTDPGTDGGTSTDPGTDGGTTTDPGANGGTTTAPDTNGGTTTAPGTNGGTTTAPGTNGGTTTAPGTNGGTTTAPGTNGGTTTAPGTNGGTTTAPGTNGGTTTAPGTNGGTTTAPGTSGGRTDTSPPADGSPPESSTSEAATPSESATVTGATDSGGPTAGTS
ncbi:DUF6777 domain-containing protein [Streptomyces dengpaensis]|uniref:DUF6777 domain-containing protein n=1 Tax=Streptomyces dengpaensis TaxID=2049881 RepID=UPI00142D2FEC|nr:DUF6777 domain-containing protein [Streptomyces dengpaensis]